MLARLLQILAFATTVASTKSIFYNVRDSDMPDDICHDLASYFSNQLCLSIDLARHSKVAISSVYSSFLDHWILTQAFLISQGLFDSYASYSEASKHIPSEEEEVVAELEAVRSLQNEMWLRKFLQSLPSLSTESNISNAIKNLCSSITIAQINELLIRQMTERQDFLEGKHIGSLDEVAVAALNACKGLIPVTVLQKNRGNQTMHVSLVLSFPRITPICVVFANIKHRLGVVAYQGLSVLKPIDRALFEFNELLEDQFDPEYPVGVAYLDYYDKSKGCLNILAF